MVYAQKVNREGRYTFNDYRYTFNDYTYTFKDYRQESSTATKTA